MLDLGFPLLSSFVTLLIIDVSFLHDHREDRGELSMAVQCLCFLLIDLKANRAYCLSLSESQSWQWFLCILPGVCTSA